MIQFEIMSRVLPIGTRKGKTVYYAQPKTNQRMTYRALVEQIVRATSLSAGDVSNALISLSNVVCEALRQGMSVDLAELGSLRLVVSSKMMNSPEEVTVKDALNKPRIQFIPKAPMREAALSVDLNIDRERVTPAPTQKPNKPGEGGGGTGGSGTPGTGGDDSGSGDSGGDDLS